MLIQEKCFEFNKVLEYSYCLLLQANKKIIDLKISKFHQRSSTANWLLPCLEQRQAKIVGFTADFPDDTALNSTAVGFKILSLLEVIITFLIPGLRNIMN